MRLPNTVPAPAPEPATPTVAAAVLVNLAAVSRSFVMLLVWKLWLGIHGESEVRRYEAAKLLWFSSISVSDHFSTAAEWLAQQLRSAPDQGGCGDEFDTEYIFRE